MDWANTVVIVQKCLQNAVKSYKKSSSKYIRDTMDDRHIESMNFSFIIYKLIMVKKYFQKWNSFAFPLLNKKCCDERDLSALFAKKSKNVMTKFFSLSYNVIGKLFYEFSFQILYARTYVVCWTDSEEKVIELLTP